MTTATPPLPPREACPACDDRTPGNRTGHVDRDTYDGVLWWSCQRCGYAWSRGFPLGSALDLAAKRAVVSYLAPPDHPLAQERRAG